ncbi:MAG: type VI secretion system baseplate subunit TssK [Planctomycetota bacterium]|nr:type VI secretion system baseplate subunit TssK [Planctomycetota bacterium]
MSHQPVAWTEGMYLRPHHFQASDRYWSEQLDRSVAWHTPYAYGFQSLKINADAVAAGDFELLSCALRLRDGTTVEVGRELGRISLQQALSAQSSVTVAVAVPRLRPEGRNLSQSASELSMRFRELPREPADEQTGENPQEVVLRELALRLCLETDVRDGAYDYLPVARVRRAGVSPIPTLDSDYCPPLLHVGTVPEFHAEYVQGVVDMLSARADLLSTQVRNRGVALTSSQMGDLERILMLQGVNHSIAALGAMARTVELHPYPVYVELCRTVGQLVIISPERSIRQFAIPAYNHDDLVPVFRALRDQIRMLLEMIKPFEFDQVPFLGDGVGMGVRLDPKWLSDDWVWVVGARSEELQQLSDRDRLLEVLRGVNWTIGPKSKVEQYFSRRMVCIRYEKAVRIPSALAGMDSDWCLFTITKQGPEWEEVRRENSLVLRFANDEAVNGQEAAIVNDNSARPPRKVHLRFCLFAVKKMSGLG